jgi:hypothetical protein
MCKGFTILRQAAHTDEDFSPGISWRIAIGRSAHLIHPLHSATYYDRVGSVRLGGVAYIPEEWPRT